jgi:signal peptidase I
MNYRRIIFTGYSMYPALRPGDTLILQHAVADDCAPGDIVCIARENGCVVHRIITVDGSRDFPRIITKGDSLTYPDPPVPLPPEGIPRVIMISRAGRGLIRPRYGSLIALLSRANLTAGIIRGKAAGIFRTARGRLYTLFRPRITL